MRAILLTLFLVLAPSARAESVLLRVEILGVESTNYTMECLDPGDDEAGCIVWNLWYIYEARVKQVVSGEFAGRTVIFAMYAHSQYNPDTFDDWYVVIEQFENADTAKKLGTPYFTQNPKLPRTYVCFENARASAFDREAFLEDPRVKSDGNSCYDTLSFLDEDEFYSCEDLDDDESSQVCRQNSVKNAEKNLVEIERRIRLKYQEAYGDWPWREVRSKAFAAFDRSVAEFRRYRKATCAFEATRSGAAEYRRRLELECDNRLLNERIRMLYRQQWLN